MSDAPQLEARVRALEGRLQSTEERLAAAEAVQEIQNLKARYGELVDSRYDQGGPRPADELARIADEIVLLFSEDAVWDGGPRLGLWQGRDKIRERFLEPTLAFTQHYFVKPRLEVTGDTARGRWDILAPITYADGRAGWMAGVEHDEYARVEGRWLHTRMRLDVIFMGPGDRGWTRR